VEYSGTNSTLTYQKLSTALNKYPKNSTIQQFTTGVLKKASCQEEKTAKHNAAVRQLPNLLPPLHHSMTPTMKRRKRAPMFNKPQNKNNPKKHCLLCVFFNVLAERKCSR
jgi:hypothetical protein